MAGYESAGVPEGIEDRLKRVEAEREFLMNECATLRQQLQIAELRLMGVAEDDLPF